MRCDETGVGGISYMWEVYGVVGVSTYISSHFHELIAFSGRIIVE
jgi:hypothetical protein